MMICGPLHSSEYLLHRLIIHRKDFQAVFGFLLPWYTSKEEYLKEHPKTGRDARTCNVLNFTLD